MHSDDFEKLVDSSFDVIPERFREKAENVVVVVEDEPSAAMRAQQGLAEDETLLGLYTGIPHTERGVEYGVGLPMPDMITLFRKPILEAAMADGVSVKQVVRDTIWHEFAHHFGLDEEEVEAREAQRAEEDASR